MPGVMTREEEGEGFSASWVTIEEEEAALEIFYHHRHALCREHVAGRAGAAGSRSRALPGRAAGRGWGDGSGSGPGQPGNALGPKTCERVFVTRHIKAYLPETIDSKAATLCAIAPGVLGATGLGRWWPACDPARLSVNALLLQTPQAPGKCRTRA